MPHPAQEALPQASPRGGAESRPRKSETADGWMERSTRRATPGPKPEGRGQWRSMTGSGGGEGGWGGPGGALANAVCNNPTGPAKPHSPSSSSQEHFPTSEHPEHLEPQLLAGSERESGQEPVLSAATRGRPGLHPLRFLRPWPSYLPALSLSFFICKMGITEVPRLC